jgi:hypothetical protein
MTFLKSTLYASVLATLSLLSAEKSIAQSYSVLNVTTEGSIANANCDHINNNGTVVCSERNRFSATDPLNFQGRLTFDNPFFTSFGRDVPTISGFPIGQEVVARSINMASVVTGLLFDHDPHAVIRHVPFAVANAPGIVIDRPTGSFTGIATFRGMEVSSVNDQGWMILQTQYQMADFSSIHESYLRKPSSTGIGSGTNSLITCPGEQPALAHQINRNGLISGECLIGGETRPVIWAWWDLNNPVNLYSLLPTAVDPLGTGLIPRTESTYYSCLTLDLADRADVLLIECTGLTERSRFTNKFIVSAAGSRQLSRFVMWNAVNAQKCVIGTALSSNASPDQAMIDCGKGARSLSELSGTVINTAIDINDQGQILAYSNNPTRRYVVLAPR